MENHPLILDNHSRTVADYLLWRSIWRPAIRTLVLSYRNSTLMTWLIKNTALTTGVGLTQWKKFAVERLPIPRIPPAKQRPFVRLVDSILRVKDADSEADTTEQEAEIDQMVYRLYGLTAEETVSIRMGRI